MAKKGKMFHKTAAIQADTTLTMTVSKTGGPVVTAVEVGSTGSDDESFSDQQLTPGPAQKALDGNNSYSLVWTGAFVTKGSATLQVNVGGTSLNPVAVNGEGGDTFFRIVIIP
jgi:hypothetical protein